MNDTSTDRESEFICDRGEDYLSVCRGHPFFREHEGKRYCVFHFPSQDKQAAFDAALKGKLEDRDFNFRGVWFPSRLSFKDFNFSSIADFSYARFSEAAIFQGATFDKQASFASAIFNSETNFAFVTFCGHTSFTDVTFNSDAFFPVAKFKSQTYFYATKFNANATFLKVFFDAEVIFTDAKFKGEANFTRATIGGTVSFWDVTFNGKTIFREARICGEANFSEATFKDYAEFTGTDERQPFGDESSLDFQFVKIEKPDRVSFHSLSLHPSWFINLDDAHKINFSNVQWINSRKTKSELLLLKDKGVAHPHRLLTIACRKLAMNAQENDRFREASQFRRMAMDVERLETWSGLGFIRLSWWYWLASGYGERPFQALVVLVGLMLLCAVLYTRVGFARWEPKLANEADVALSKRDDAGTPLRFSRAVTYSGAVMTFQRPEPRPATTAAQTIVLLETILGPVQAALLALAIRRKFMR